MAEDRDSIYGIQSLLSRLEIQGTLTTALIDSGAAVSVIRLSTLDGFERSVRSLIEQPDIQATSVNGVSLFCRACSPSVPVVSEQHKFFRKLLCYSGFERPSDYRV